MAQEPLTYDEWVRRAASEEVPPPADGVLHFGERAALVEQLSYLKRRNAKLSRQQRAVLLGGLRGPGGARALRRLRRRIIVEER